MTNYEGTFTNFGGVGVEKGNAVKNLASFLCKLKYIGGTKVDCFLFFGKGTFNWFYRS